MQEKITACFPSGCDCDLNMTLNERGRIVKIRGDGGNPHFADRENPYFL